MLNLRQSFLAYKLISILVENEEFNDDILALSDSLLRNAREKGKDLELVQLMSILIEKPEEEIVKMDMDIFIHSLLKSISDNRILDLIDFYRGLNG